MLEEGTERNKSFRAEEITNICKKYRVFNDGTRRMTTAITLALVLSLPPIILFAVPVQIFAFEQFDGDDGPVPVPLEGQALITVSYNDDWIGSISEGGSGISSVDGKDTHYFLINCDGEGFIGNTYAATFSKSDNDDDLMTVTVTGPSGDIIDSGKTTAEFGLVSLGGPCD